MIEQLSGTALLARTPGERVAAGARLENAACAFRLSAMADLLALAQAADGSADREQWRLDNWAAVCAHIGAAQQVTSGVASTLLMDAIALRERLPKVAALFAQGLLSYRLVHAICLRTALVRDPDAIAAVDADLAAELAGRGAMSVLESEQLIDTLVLTHDPEGVYRTEERARQCSVDVHVDDASGVARLSGRLLASDGKALDQRLDLLARTVCAHDPRDLDQRRSAAAGALGYGWDRLPCLCERPDCTAASKPAGGGVVVHVIARQQSIDTQADPSQPHPDDPGPSEPEPDEPDDPALDEPNEPAFDEPAFEEPLAEDVEDTEAFEDRDVASHDDDAVPADPEPDWATDELTPAEPPNHPEPPEPPVQRDLTAQRRALVGASPPLLPKPWYTYSWSGLLEACTTPGEGPAAPPAVILGGSVLPAPVAAHAAMHATFKPLIHPGQAPPEPRYRPSAKLAEFVRCRDLHCRFPGCTKPATVCDLDHVVPWPYGPTCAANLACLCREHHLLKTFWPGWSVCLHPDGTMVWTDPDHRTHTSYPGSRTLFPELCTPTAPFTARGTPPPKHTAGLTMPRRTTTRAQARRHRIDAERQRDLPETARALLATAPPY